MNKKVTLGAALTFIAIAVAITITMTMFFSQSLFNEKVADLAEREAMYARLAEVDKYIRANANGVIDEASLGDELVRGYVNGLGDRYAEYYTAAEYAAQINSISGKMVGIGVNVMKSDDDYMRVTSTYADSPAQASGILADDLIIKVDNIDVTRDTYDDAVALIGTGEIGSTVTLVIRRQNEDMEIVCTRREIEVESVGSKIFNETIGYIRVDEFSNASVSQFQTVLGELHTAGVTSLLLDLRGNPGGSIEAMAKIADLLLPEGEIVKAVYQNGVEKVLHRSDSSEVSMPIIVLQNNETASSAEMLIAALQDYGKCRTVGTTTYGKNVMQEIHQFTDGSAVKITTAQLYSPLGNTYDGIGITPDTVVNNETTDRLPLSLLDLAGDAQLSKAVELAADWVKSFDYPDVTTEAMVGA